MKRVCVLTGASGALGRAFLCIYAHQYDIVGVHFRRPIAYATQTQHFVDPLSPTRSIEDNEHAIDAYRCDLREPVEIERLVEYVSERYGRVDLLVNGAALMTHANLVSSTAVDAAPAITDLNVLAPLRLANAFARRLWRDDLDGNLRSNCNIVNVSSVSGLYVYPDSSLGMYAASKAALIQLSYHMAVDFWDIGVRVNVVAPDSFPGRTSAEAVAEGIVRFDQGSETGILSVISDHERAAIPEAHS